MEQYREKTFFNGITIGKIYQYKRQDYQINRYKVFNIESEIARYEKAKKAAIDQLNILYNKAVEEAGKANANLFEAYIMILKSENYNDSVYNLIRKDEINAEFAVTVTGDIFVKMFDEMDDEYFKARSTDIKDITERLILALTGIEQDIYMDEEPVIVIAEDLTPSEIIQMDKTKLLALVTKHGSRNSHTAILARTMNIPALFGIDIQEEWNGKMAIVDGKEGKLIIEPDYATLEHYIAIQNKELNAGNLLIYLKGQPDITLDGREINVYANIGSLADVSNVLENDAAGIGLFRSEFLYLEKDNYPTEEEQFHVYRTVAQKMVGRKVVIRTLDIGADKQVDYFNIEHENNPAMGYRAIRICLDRRDIFKTQLRALYRAAAYGTISIMFPMIISVKEIHEIKAICEEVKSELNATHTDYGEVELGIMIETPAAVMISDVLAKEVDFFSIGTNDLTQYTLAIDRQNAKLDPFYDAHHPAVLRMIQMVIDNGHKEGCRVGICGELGADLSLTEIFIKMGIDELSVSPNKILSIRKIIRESNYN